MKRPDTLKMVGAVLLLVAAGLYVYRQVLGRLRPGTHVFHDASAACLFHAARVAVPPIRGIDGPEEDGFRALVVSTTGRPEDRKSWQVAYLERFSPELKRATEEAQRTGTALAMGRLEAQAHRFVRRLAETEWHAMTSPEGEAIVNGWARPGPDGVTPIPCTP
jgi:hypothetical protein